MTPADMLRFMPFGEQRRLGNWWLHSATPPARFVEALREACAYPGLTAALLFAERDGVDRKKWHVRNAWWLCELIESREGVDDVWRRTLRPAGRLRDAEGRVIVGLDICNARLQTEAIQRCRANYLKTWGEIGDDMMAAHDARDRMLASEARAAAGEIGWRQRARITNGHRTVRTRAERIAEEAKLERDIHHGNTYNRQLASILQTHGARV